MQFCSSYSSDNADEEEQEEDGGVIVKYTHLKAHKHSSS